MAVTPDQGAKAGAQVGRSVPRLEGRDKVTGRAEYTHTMRLPGMLHAKIFRSTVAHGRIKSVDVGAAKTVPGVMHVVTIDDVRRVIADPYYGPAFHDQPILADGKVRFVGEPVAVVIATDPHVADEAVQLIAADYEELPAVFDEVDALTSKVDARSASGGGVLIALRKQQPLPQPSPASGGGRRKQAHHDRGSHHQLKLNGAPVTADVEPHHNLVEMLQAQFALTGARETCGQGLCGCCTVLVNGRAERRLWRQLERERF